MNSESNPAIRLNETGLLVSIRDHLEAESCRPARIDILDIKEPDRGSLGRADAAMVSRILNVHQHPCVSIALGELHELADRDQVTSLFSQLDWAQIRFAKIGLSRMAGKTNWEAAWRGIVRRLPQHVAPVAAAYFDCEAADSPPVEQVFEIGAGLGCSMALLDTFDKSAGSILNRAPIERLIGLRQLANGSNMGLVLAGSLGSESLAAVGVIAPQYVGVRGAVCGQRNRTSSLSPSALHTFAARLHSETRAGNLSRRQNPNSASCESA